MILVTGGTGFVGRNLIVELLKNAFTVRCLVRDPLRAAFLREAHCQLAQGDVRDRSSVLKAIDSSIDTVIHLVGILYETRGASFKELHVEGTRNVVEACMEKGVKRYLHISALGTRAGARSAYHKTKWEAEEIIRASNLEYTVFRPSVIFGKEDKFTNLFADLMRFSPVIMIPGDGKNRMQPVFVNDLVRAMADSIRRAETKRMVYEAAGRDVLTFDEIIDSIAEVLGKTRIKIHIPMPLMRINAALLEILPKPPITKDALLMLEEDNVTPTNALPMVFGIKPTGFVEGMKTYLH